MIFRNLPALMTLAASLIVCIITIVYRYNATKAFAFILATAVIFFLAGLLIRFLLNRFLVTEEAAEEPGEGEESQEENGAEN